MSDKNKTSDQYQRFVETARKLEADEDKARFEKRLGKLARPSLNGHEDDKSDKPVKPARDPDK